jgi:hypothetical protein
MRSDLAKSRSGKASDLLEVAQSPRTGESIWEPPNRWATLEDIGLLGWFDRIVIESDDD